MKNIKKIAVFCLILVLSAAAITAITLSACKKNNQNSSSSEQQESLTISEKTIELFEDEIYTLTATTGSGESVKWSSSNAKVVSVSAKGLVIAKSVGEAVVYAKAGDTTKECKVKVVKDTGSAVIEFEKNVINLSVATGAEKIVGCVTINGKKSALDKNNATFAVDNDKIAKVSADGTITPITPGSTFVFVTSGKKTKVISVEVYTMLIATAEDWNAMLSADGDLTARYLVVSDIDFTGVEYVVKSENTGDVYLAKSFAGYLNGDGHSVKNITMPSAVSEQSLFGTIVGAQIENISFENVRFTAVANGLAVRMMHHYNEVDDDGNTISGEMTVAYNVLKNIALDFVYDYNGIKGICGGYYGGGLENVFLNMRMSDGKSFNKSADYAFTDEFFLWRSNNYINNFIVLAEQGEVSLDWHVNTGSLDVGKETIFVCGNKMEACYQARTIFDPVVWSVVPGELPKLK